MSPFVKQNLYQSNPGAWITALEQKEAALQQEKTALQQKKAALVQKETLLLQMQVDSMKTSCKWILTCMPVSFRMRGFNKAIKYRETSIKVLI